MGGPLSTGAGGTGGTGTGHDTSRFDEWLRARLKAKEYQELRIGPQDHPVRLAFRWPGSVWLPPRVVAVVGHVSEPGSVTDICKRLEPWFTATVANRQGGDGLLLFVCYDPSAATVDTIKAAGFYAGHAAIAVGAYDFHSGKHWVSPGTACEADIFGT